MGFTGRLQPSGVTNPSTKTGEFQRNTKPSPGAWSGALTPTVSWPRDPPTTCSRSHRQRLAVGWKAVAPSLADEISPSEVREDFGIHHPVSTSVSIKPARADALIRELDRRFAR